MKYIRQTIKLWDLVQVGILSPAVSFVVSLISILGYYVSRSSTVDANTTYLTSYTAGLAHSNTICIKKHL